MPDVFILGASCSLCIYMGSFLRWHCYYACPYEVKESTWYTSICVYFSLKKIDLKLPDWEIFAQRETLICQTSFLGKKGFYVFLVKTVRVDWRRCKIHSPLLSIFLSVYLYTVDSKIFLLGQQHVLILCSAFSSMWLLARLLFFVHRHVAGMWNVVAQCGWRKHHP